MVRKQHNAGYKHKANVKSYYTQFCEYQEEARMRAAHAHHGMVRAAGAGVMGWGMGDGMQSCGGGWEARWGEEIG